MQKHGVVNILWRCVSSSLLTAVWLKNSLPKEFIMFVSMHGIARSRRQQMLML